MKRKIKKFPFLIIRYVISILLIMEFMLTGLGYCGHSHDHGSIHDACMTDDVHLCDTQHDEIIHSHSQSCDADSDSCDNQACHCSCLGGFVADIHLISFQVYHTLHFSKNEYKPNYHFSYSPTIYRPPII